MFVVIVGGGRTGTQLASILILQKHQVHIIERRPAALPRIQRQLPTEIITAGNTPDPLELEQTSAKKAENITA